MSNYDIFDTYTVSVITTWSIISITIVTLLTVRIAANCKTGLVELKNNSRSGVNFRLVTPLNSVIALAASNTTVSTLC